MSEEIHNPGQGVARTQYPLPSDPSEVKVTPAPEPEADDVAEEHDAKGDPIWSPTPSFADQLARYPKTCKLTNLTIETFDCSKPAELEKLNALYARQLPKAAPSVVLEASLCDRKFNGRTFIFLVGYYTVVYKRLLKRT